MNAISSVIIIISATYGKLIPAPSNPLNISATLLVISVIPRPTIKGISEFPTTAITTKTSEKIKLLLYGFRYFPKRLRLEKNSFMIIPPQTVVMMQYRNKYHLFSEVPYVFLLLQQHLHLKLKFYLHPLLFLHVVLLLKL